MNQDWESSKIGRRRGLEAGGRESPELRELRQEIRELRRTGTKREPRRPSSPERRNLRYEGSRAREVRAYRSKRRRRIVAAAGVAVVVLVIVLNAAPGSSRSFRLPNRTALAGMALGQRIVAIAQSQIGYTTDPNDSYCNKFSAYWGAGASSCPGGEASEEWCADFAAWAWQKAGYRSPLWVWRRRSERRRDQLLQLGCRPRHVASGGQWLPGGRRGCRCLRPEPRVICIGCARGHRRRRSAPASEDRT